MILKAMILEIQILKSLLFLMILKVVNLIFLHASMF